MTIEPNFSRLTINGVVILDTAARGIRETRTWVHAAQVERDVNGSMMLGTAMKSPWGKKARYRWDATGPGILELPAFDHLEPLSVLTITPIYGWLETITAGDTEHVLARMPVADSVAITDPVTGLLVPHSRAGKTVTLFGQPRHVQTYYDPILQFALIEATRDIDEDKQLYSWSLEVEEV